MRGRAAVTSVTPDDLVAAREGDVLELTRGQETELPQALKWQLARSDEDYDAAQVEARRITVDTTRIASESFPMAVPPEEAERRCCRALMEAWTGRESAVFRLPPSRLALDPGDVVALVHDGRAVPLRLVSIADSDARGIEAVRQDREAYDLPPGSPRPSAPARLPVFGAPEAVLLDLPQLFEDALAIETAPGVWEIVQASAAELIAPGRYRLTRLLRGQRGTEHAMGNPAPAGARIVVLDDSLAVLPIAEADLGIPWTWRVGPASKPVSDETYVAHSFTPEGVGLRPFSVAHVEQPWRRSRSSGDVTIRWTRRSRALAADSWTGREVPLAEEGEAYEVDILDGSSVRRVLSSTTTSALYSAAAQTADLGALLGPGDTLDIRIAQVSALLGRGQQRTVTLVFQANAGLRGGNP